MPTGYSLHNQRNGVSLAERLARFSVRAESGCLEWSGAVSKNGYGAVTNPGSGQMRTHRAAWIVAFGEIPAGKCVCHRCDNRRCVEPSHLFLGTQMENIHDMVRKGRLNTQVRARQKHLAALAAEKRCGTEFAPPLNPPSPWTNR